MANKELLETIRKEIINRIDKRHLSAQAQNELVSVLSFLDTLQEQPVDWQKVAEAHAKDQPLGQDNDGNLVYLQEQPVDLEKEIENYAKSYNENGINLWDWEHTDDAYSDMIRGLASHFYELGRQSKKRELLPMIERICVSCPEKVKAESALNKFTSKNCVHCSIEHCPGVKACYTSSNEQLQ